MTDSNQTDWRRDDVAPLKQKISTFVWQHFSLVLKTRLEGRSSRIHILIWWVDVKRDEEPWLNGWNGWNVWNGWVAGVARTNMSSSIHVVECLMLCLVAADDTGPFDSSPDI